MHVRVLTNRYEAIHARLPRGTGRWAFQVGPQVEFFSGSYASAKQQAIARAKALHAASGAPWTAVLYVDVLP